MAYPILSLDEEDVVRHRLVKAIIKAYERDKKVNRTPAPLLNIVSAPLKQTLSLWNFLQASFLLLSLHIFVLICQ